MNTIKYLLLGLIAPLLCGISFGLDLSQDDITYLNKVALSSGDFTSVNGYTLYQEVNNNNFQLCVIFNDLNILYNGTDASGNKPFFVGGVGNTNNNARDMYWSYNHGFNLFCYPIVNNYFRISAGLNGTMYFSTSQYWVLKVDDIVNGNMGIDVDSLVNNLQDCQSNLNTCDTTVQQCLIDKDSLSGSLASCNSDKNSLQNYNDSLTEQLTQCLNDNLSGDYISGSFLRYSMFWNDNESMFSLPITNDLFLPVGYKGKLNEDNVLSIAPINTIENALLFDDEAKNTTVNSLAYIMLFLIASGLIMVLLRFLKKLFKL